jgi:putative inorganic carbon (hco3(-)) transporter
MSSIKKNKRLAFPALSIYGWISPAVNKPQYKLRELLYFIIPVFFAGIIGILTAYNVKLGVGVAGALCCAGVLLICILSAEAGIYLSLAYSFLISYFDRLLFTGEFTEGVGSDFLIAGTFIGLIIRRVNLKQDFNELFKSPIFKLLLLIYIYTTLQVFNPYALTLNGWYPAFRKIVGNFLLIIITYNALNSIEVIKRYFKVLFILSVIVGIYACIQEWHDFFDFEMDWLQAEHQRFIMTYVNGGARRISTMPGALELAIIMAVCASLYTGMGILQKKISHKIILTIGVIFMLLGMSFALTRTSNVMYVGGVFLFFLITFDRPISRFATIAGAILFFTILFGPFYNSHVGQFRNTFLGGTKDASYLVREVNRKSIQTYMYSHPFGGGVNTSGDEGKIYSPGHRLAGFPPDSGMLKKAIEIGWIGFTIIMIMYFMILKAGIKGYFEASTPQNKMIYACSTAACFSLYLGDFSQVALGQITDVMVYYPLLVIILRLNKLTQPDKTLQTT